MAGRAKRGGERVLESRHLVGLFLGVVLLCAVFFTLGYVMGRTQYGGPVHAADAIDPRRLTAMNSSKPKEPDQPAAPAGGEWDFYSKKDNNHLDAPETPAHSPKADQETSSPAASPPAKLNGGAPGKSPAPHASGTQAANSSKSNAPGSTASKNNEPAKLVKGSIVLQVAAVTHQSDAVAMANALQQKHFPCFVLPPTDDKFYRVQVGPYADDRTADAAKAALDRAGFKAIIKRAE